ncbi:hypothetical protein AB1Y20_019461 [Prymnesium parvum]|uniref:Palmitoyltransferase n=1 Tax=Prymnesium parvum TaxID=97485 RepID=A0AB34JR91_PRYPA
MAASCQPIDAQAAPPRPCAVAPCTGFRFLASPMFVVVWCIVAINYAPYVLWTPRDTVVRWLCVIVFHVLVALLLGSYVMCVFTDPGTVPVEWHEAVAKDEALAASHRLCPKTRMYRPLRSHYCSVTRRVVLNMDHFCPWVVNTVGFYNRKFFVLFLMYTLLSCLWVIFTSVPLIFALKDQKQYGEELRRIGAKWGSNRLMVAMLAMLLDAALSVMLLCFFSFHVRMVLLNETTIEGPSSMYNINSRANWEQVFGTNKWLWFLPVYGGGPAGDGVHWPSRRRRQAGLQQLDEIESGQLLTCVDTSDSSAE